MSDEVSLFDTGAPKSVAGPRAMSDSQRQVIRDAFARLGVSGARDQFDIVEEVTGHRIVSVNNMNERTAQALIIGLHRRLETAGRQRTGNAWADREEDTWIDRL
ncbi:hypothetical protein [Naasia lichenicola]|uniref:Uncharacterized protein n=1 Tax=Naasia lichenicola TaxID=2565933 RepID=A0A4S4FGE3_9MICO|nr:hypothetical protein [Naasia lichenicola]THG29283.1 hypothetical protein E6C64_11190 [Naasia lichenicola]